jgi:hypothetical protein
MDDDLNNYTIEEFLKSDAGRYDIRGHAIGAMWGILKEMNRELQQYRQLADQLGYTYDTKKKAWIPK